MNWTKTWQAIGGRKFLAFAIASVFLAYRLISQEIWVTAFATYVGANVVQKALTGKKE